MPKLNISHIRSLLEEKQINDRQLADQLQVDPSTVSNWMHGYSFPSEENLEKLVDFLCITKQELVEPDTAKVNVQNPKDTVVINNFDFDVEIHIENQILCLDSEHIKALTEAMIAKPDKTKTNHP